MNTIGGTIKHAIQCVPLEENMGSLPFALEEAEAEKGLRLPETFSVAELLGFPGWLFSSRSFSAMNTPSTFLCV